MSIAYPTPGTLHKYGLTLEDFKRILEAQGGVCPICKQTPKPSKRDGKIRWVIDHQHVKGWKNMPPEKRRLYVRGVCCWYDNRYFLSKGITPEKARNMIAYLTSFLKRLEERQTA